MSSFSTQKQTAETITKRDDIIAAHAAGLTSEYRYTTYPVGHPECLSGGVVISAKFTDGSSIILDHIGQLTTTRAADVVEK